MWAGLTDPGLAACFDCPGEVPMRRVVEALAQRPYATAIFAYTSMGTFNITTAPTYADHPGRDTIHITYSDTSRTFSVAYLEWGSRRRPRPHNCEEAEVLEVVDRYVTGLLMVRGAGELA